VLCAKSSKSGQLQTFLVGVGENLEWIKMQVASMSGLITFITPLPLATPATPLKPPLKWKVSLELRRRNQQAETAGVAGESEDQRQARSQLQELERIKRRELRASTSTGPGMGVEGGPAEVVNQKAGSSSKAARKDKERSPRESKLSPLHITMDSVPLWQQPTIGPFWN
jgi:hypothetical protein